MNKPSLFALAAIGFSLAVGFGGQAHAGSNDAAFLCHSRISLPSGKEELTLFDVKQAVEQHLLRIGAPNRKVKVNWEKEEFIKADIFDQRGQKRRHLVVDAAMAQIVVNKMYRRPVGFANETGPRVTYRRKLRQHMMGDGKPWADWIKAAASPGGCFDDYHFGAPDFGPGS